jgi:cytoskeletal protein CcmA (bactofilin family)
MFREKGEALDMSVHNITDNTTILKEDASFEGKLVFEGSVMVNGKFKGEIYSSGELIIGRSGFVEGEVEIGVINIHGEVKGNIRAKQKIVINSPAVVRGDITAPSLIIEEGAVFEGNCSMGNVANNEQRERSDRDRSNIVDFQKTAE